VTASQQIKKATGVTGFAVRSQMNEELPWWVDFANWPYGFNGGWSDGKNLTIDRPENIAAVKALKAVYDSGAFAVGDDASTFRQKFKEGKVAMMIDNSATVDTLVHQNTVVPSTSVVASKLPFPGTKSAHVGTLIGINANSPNKKLAKEWLSWMLTDEGQKAMSSALSLSTVATDLETPANLVEANPWLPAFRAQAANSANPLIPGFELETAQIRPIILTQIARVLSQDADPAQALGQAQRAAEKISR
jgi:multiple sugar transport system substrate-binding protein